MISFMSANYVARETGWSMQGWGHGDRVTNERFRPLETFAERFGELVGLIRGLGFEAVDVWGGHLNPAWATDEHLAIARELLANSRLRVATFAAWVDEQTIERACEIARALGTTILGAGASGDLRTLVTVLRERGVRLAIENHPERSPAEVLAKIEAGDGTLGATLDTGWWATQGYDPVRAIEELGGKILHVHLKDVLASGDPHVTCRWGRGIVPVEDCVHALRRLGYGAAISVEHEPEHEDPSEDCRAMLAELREWWT